MCTTLGSTRLSVSTPPSLVSASSELFFCDVFHELLNFPTQERSLRWAVCIYSPLLVIVCFQSFHFEGHFCWDGLWALCLLFTVLHSYWLTTLFYMTRFRKNTWESNTYFQETRGQATRSFAWYSSKWQAFGHTYGQMTSLRRHIFASHMHSTTGFLDMARFLWKYVSTCHVAPRDTWSNRTWF